MKSIVAWTMASLMLLSTCFTVLYAVKANRRFVDIERALEKSQWLKGLMVFAQGGIRNRTMVSVMVVVMLINKERSARKKMMEWDVSERFPIELERSLRNSWRLMFLFGVAWFVSIGIYWILS